MELEQRVKLLEQEVKLLKNEVQATLLDIQEQLLSTRYPDLRTEVSRSPATRAEAPDLSEQEKPLAKPVLSAAVKVIRSVELDPPQPPAATHPQMSSNGKPAARPVPSTPPQSPAQISPALRQPKAQVSAATPNRATSAVKAARPSAPKPVSQAGPDATLLSEKARREVQANVTDPIDWGTLDQQAEWTLRVVRQHGLEYTHQLIEVYTRQGLLSEKVGEVLHQVAATFQMEGPPAEKEPDKNPANGAVRSGALDKSLRSVIVRIIHHLQSIGAEKGTRNG